MDILQRSLRIMFRNILKDAGLEHKSYDCCVCSVTYAYQLVCCVKCIGPFFLYVDGNDAVIKHFTINNMTDNVLYTFPKFIECNTWEVNKFCISDPDMYNKMILYIRNYIECNNINNTPDLSKIQVVVCDKYPYSCAVNGIISLKESTIKHFIVSKYPSINAYPNIRWQKPGFISRILQYIIRFFNGHDYTKCLMHSIMRHVRCDKIKAMAIIKDADMFYNLGSQHYDMERHTEEIIKNNK